MSGGFFWKIVNKFSLLIVELLKTLAVFDPINSGKRFLLGWGLFKKGFSNLAGLEDLTSLAESFLTNSSSFLGSPKISFGGSSFFCSFDTYSFDIYLAYDFLLKISNRLIF